MRANLSHLPPPTVRSQTPICSLVAAAILAGCAAAWNLGDPVPDAAPPAPVPAHRAVISAMLEFRGRRVPLLVHLAAEGAGGAVRAHVGTEGGLTALDVTVRGEDTVVHGSSALAEHPGLREALVEDLRRLYGSRSPSALARVAGPPRAAAGGGDRRVAFPLPDGSWLAVPQGAGDAFTATLLDRSLLPEAEVEFGARDGDGIPLRLAIRDLRDGHALRLEVERVLPPGSPAETSP